MLVAGGVAAVRVGESGGGIAPAIVGSLLLVAVATVIALANDIKTGATPKACMAVVNSEARPLA